MSSRTSTSTVGTRSGPAAPDDLAHACDGGVRRAFELLGKRWNGVIVGTLSAGPVGFADLRRGVGGITDSVLSDRLSELIDVGLVDRTVTDSRPPGVSYELTPAGHELLPILHRLGSWAEEHIPAARG